MSDHDTRTPQTPMTQLRSGWRYIMGILATSTVFIVIVLVVSEWDDVPTQALTRDPTAELGGSLYIGFLSQVGLLCWAASGAICIVGARVLADRSDAPEMARFLLISGLISIYLGFDDAFRMHEDLYPKFGIPQKLVQVAYLALMAFFLVTWRKLIFRTEYVLLALSLAFFSASLVFDNYRPTRSALVEDGSKFVGLVAWLVYFFLTVTAELRADSDAPPSDSPRPAAPQTTS